MSNKEANNRVNKLHNRFKKHLACQYPQIEDVYIEAEFIRKEALKLHNVVGLYEVITPINALKMASICSSLRFVQPFRMLIALEKTIGDY